MPQLITVSEFLSLARISRMTEHRLRKDGLGPRSLQIGGRVMFDIEDVKTWIERQKVNA
jgi:predicted DNA-binding transcriptional regulator AlpA